MAEVVTTEAIITLNAESNGVQTLSKSSDTRHSLTAFAKEEAHRRGFDLVGVTTPDAPPHMEVYRRWLAQGHHAGMHYMASERAISHREKPRMILPECKSVLVTGTLYLTPESQNRKDNTRVKVASYALGEDYHLVLTDRLRRLVGSLEARLGESFPHRTYTDTGPLLEREFAQRSGLGWIGKNSCLIHPKKGSYFLLAEVMLGLDLIPDQPFTSDHCGNCTRCIEACPTDCILPNRTIDSSRCISYLTIEEKGAIPPELRSDLGKWLFGCDICQQVCPWNLRFAAASTDPAFQPREMLRSPDPGRFLELAPEKWRPPLRNSPLERPRRVGLVRNACIVAGNSGDPVHIPRLKNLLFSDTDELVRAHAAWALGEIGGRESKLLLEEALLDEAEESVREEIRCALHPGSV
ncbi:MAG: tRNA epoxyqueuosine(34) reductase QueG [Anaerolineales bacterium]